MLRKGINHPCRDTCSGWKQGKERGIFEAKQLVVNCITEWRQGILEQVNSGDKTIQEIRPEMKQLQQLEVYILERMR